MLELVILSSIFVIIASLIILIKPNVIFILYALEIFLLGINLNFIIGSLVLDDFLGQYIGLILFAIAALDTSIGLVMILNYYNLRLTNNFLEYRIKG